MRWLRRLFYVLLAWRVAGPIVAPRFSPPQEHPWELEGRTVFAGGREFLVRQVGPTDAMDLVLIHGLGGSSLSEWYKPGRLLAERYRLTLVDHRSHGLSPKVTTRFEIEDVADDLAAVLQRLGISAALVVGYSMGGAIAQALAHRHPELVGRLVLVATMAAHPTGWKEARTAAVWIIRAWERITGVGTPEVRWAYLRGTGSVERRLSRWLWDDTHRRDLEAGAASTFSLLRFDSRSWLPDLHQPTLVIIPTRDQLVPYRWQYDMASRIRDVQVVEVAGAFHEVPWTHPERLVEAIDDFVKDGR